MHRPHAVVVAERTAWVLDDAWPEYASMIAARFAPGDQLVAPGVRGAWPSRYAWPLPVRHAAPLATIRRHVAMRRVAHAAGDVRQRAYLAHDRALAHELARAIDYRARHLVVAQAWLPWLDEAGALGGRSYDVLMSRYPLGAIHRLLDGAARALGASRSIADFRADPGLVAREAELLARARTVITPHHGIAALFADKAVRLAWHRPPPAPRRPGTRTAFLGPTIARERPDVARALAAALPGPLIVFGPIIEPAWQGIAIERRAFGPGWLDEIGTILHPATFTNQPRRLLEALASGVTVRATAECGLDPADFAPLAGALAERPIEELDAVCAREPRLAAF